MGLIGKTHEWSLLNVWDVDKQKMSSYPDPDQSTDDPDHERRLDGDVMVRRLGGHTVLFVPGIYLSDETLPALFQGRSRQWQPAPDASGLGADGRVAGG